MFSVRAYERDAYMKKRLFSMILAVLMMFLVTACGGKDSLPEGGIAPYEDITNQEYDPAWEAEQEQKYEMDAYGLDLSMYDDHGEWSFDRMWVHKTEESWDAMKSYYGYIDRDGNLVGEWHEETTFENFYEADQDDVFVDYVVQTAPWKVLGDFQGEYAVVLCSGSGDTVSTAYLEIIDLQGNSIGRFIADFGTYSYRTNELMVNEFAKRLCYDKLFWDQDMFEVCMSWIEDGNYYTKVLDGEYMCALDIHDMVNGYYPHWFYNDISNTSYYGLIASNGDHVLGGEMDYEVKGLVPSATEETVDLYFIGVDGREYVVVMDFDGNWLAEPTLAS